MTTDADRMSRLTALGSAIDERAPAIVDATMGLLAAVGAAMKPGDPVATGPLREYLRRAMGWSPARSEEVERAVREVGELVAGRGALLLVSEGELGGVARRLHHLALPGLPLVMLRRGDNLIDGLERATGGVLYLDARPWHRSRDLGALLACVREPARVRLIVGAPSAKVAASVVAGLPRVATIVIPPLRERADEIEDLLTTYAQEAAADLGAPEPGLQLNDLRWARASAGYLATLADVEEAARRLVALRTWGVAAGAERLRVTHSALSRWAQRRGIAT